jgi:hypothetical protein
VDHNYADAADGAKRAGTWVDPVLEIPIVAPDRDERIASEVTRYKALTEQVAAEKGVGAVVDQGRVNTLAGQFEVKPFTLATVDAPEDETGADSAPQQEQSTNGGEEPREDDA